MSEVVTHIGTTQEFLLNAAQFSFVFIFAAFMVLIIWQILTRKINLKGLLKDKSNGRFSPGRLQNLVLTLLVAALYLGKLLNAPVTNGLPELPENCIELIMGSSALYLGGKSSSLVGRFFSSLTKH